MRCFNKDKYNPKPSGSKALQKADQYLSSLTKKIRTNHYKINEYSKLGMQRLAKINRQKY